jgi:hypothetical protein
MPWIRRLVVGLPQWRPVFNPRSLHMGFVIAIRHWDKLFSENCGVPSQHHSVSAFNSLTHSSIIDAHNFNKSQNFLNNNSIQLNSIEFNSHLLSCRFNSAMANCKTVTTLNTPTSKAVRSKTWVCDSSFAGTVSLNPAGDVHASF